MNHMEHAYQVYAYLQKAYAPSQQHRLDEVMDTILWLEKADFASRGIDHWVLAWKDVSQKLTDMGMAMEAHHLRRRFQQSNKKINFETTTFLTPKALSSTATLDDMIEDSLLFYRANPPKNRSGHSFAALQGKRQDGSPKTYTCFDGENHSYANCPYFNRSKRPNGWTGDAAVWREIKAALDNRKDKRGGAVQGLLTRMGTTWEGIQPHGSSGEVTYMAFHASTSTASASNASASNASVSNATAVAFNSHSAAKSKYQDTWIADSGTQRHTGLIFCHPSRLSLSGLGLTPCSLSRPEHALSMP